MLCTIEKHRLIFSSYFVKVDVCPSTARGLGIGTFTRHHGAVFWGRAFYSELNVDNWNDNCEAKSEARFQALTRFAGQLALCIYM